MSVDERPEMIHPAGEGRTEENGCQLDTFGGKVEVRWNSDAEVTVMGQMAFFIEFLKTAGLWQSWVKDSPLSYTSPNAPKKEDVLGTILLSVLAGHRRYAHITAIRGDGVNPEMLGMSRVVSEDSVRRAMKGEWMSNHYCPAIRRTDSTVCLNRLNLLGSRSAEVPGKGAFSQKARG